MNFDWETYLAGKEQRLQREGCFAILIRWFATTRRRLARTGPNDRASSTVVGMKYSNTFDRPRESGSIGKTHYAIRLSSGNRNCLLSHRVFFPWLIYTQAAPKLHPRWVANSWRNPSLAKACLPRRRRQACLPYPRQVGAKGRCATRKHKGPPLEASRLVGLSGRLSELCLEHSL